VSDSARRGACDLSFAANANLGGGLYAGKRVAVNVGDNFVSCTHPAGF
jgi:hypothetical protein